MAFEPVQNEEQVNEQVNGGAVETTEQPQKQKVETYDPQAPQDENAYDDANVDEVKEDDTPASIDDFLSANVESIDTEEKVYLKRFKKPFIIRTIGAEENDEIKEDCSKLVVNRKTSVKSKQLDSEKYSDELVVRAIVQPDLNNAKLQQDCGTMGYPIRTLKHMLTVGEYAQLSNKIIELLGLNEEDINGDIEEVKK